jgi:hypothetical protein
MINNIELKGAAVAAPNVLEVAAPRPALKVDLMHHLPGRLRLRSPALKGNSLASEEARANLAAINGVTSAAANPTTGSLLLQYDPATVAPERIIHVLAAHGFVTAEQSTAREGSWTNRLATAAEGWILDALAERLVLAMIGALA